MKLFFEDFSSLGSNEDYIDRFYDLYDFDCSGKFQAPGMIHYLGDWLEDHPQALKDIVNYLNDFVIEDDDETVF